MEILIPTLDRMVFLFAFILIGYLLGKLKLIPENSAQVLSKLENYLFIPALVMGSFISNFTVSKLSEAGTLVLICLAIEAIVLPVAIFCAKLCAKDKYQRGIYTYGLCFSNFGFMGNAVVAAVFPDIFMEYLVFVIGLWVVLYVWGVPSLLIPKEAGTAPKGFARLKPLLNPMFISMIIGMLIGLSGLVLPSSVNSVLTVSGDCMSPVAMLLTGITVSKIDLAKTLKKKGLYIASVLRLIVFPVVFMGLILLFKIPFSRTVLICLMCSLAMPLGLNTVVVPGAYGKDTSEAAGMALVSHTLSVITIPLLFSFFLQFIG